MKPLCLVIGMAILIAGCGRDTQPSRVPAAVNSTKMGRLPTPTVVPANKAAASNSPTPTPLPGVPYPDQKPLIGFYRVKMSFFSGAGPGFTDVITSFRWVRLYKNGTYTTSQSKRGKIEGRWSFNSSSHTITFRNPYSEDDAMNDKHEIYDLLDGDCQKINDSHVIFWSIRSASNVGSIYLVWKKP